MNTAQQLQPVSDAAGEQQTAESWMMVGAVRATSAAATALRSQTIRGLQQIRDQRTYLQLGFKRFEDFLASDLSPMKYDKFNHWEKAIQTEGDELFDVLNSIGAPLTKRRLLGKGDVRVEGKEIVAQLDGDEEEIRVPLNNTTRILSVLTRVVDQRNEMARKITRGEKQVVSLKKKLDEARSGNSHTASGQGGFFDALLSVIGSFSVLATEAEKLPEDQRKQQREAVYEMVAEHMKRVDEALGVKMPDAVKKRGRVRVPDHLLEDDEE